MSEFGRLVERLRQDRLQQERALASARAHEAAAEVIEGCGLCIGDRVFDRVTGETGVIVGGTVENVVVPISSRRKG